MANEQIPLEIKKKLKKIYKRCRICRTKSKLQMHHIIPNGNHSKGNVIRLCHNCHLKLHQVYDEQVRARIKIEVAKIKQDLKTQGHKKIYKTGYEQVIQTEIKKQIQIIHDKFANLKKQILKELKIN